MALLCLEPIADSRTASAGTWEKCKPLGLTTSWMSEVDSAEAERMDV